MTHSSNRQSPGRAPALGAQRAVKRDVVRLLVDTCTTRTTNPLARYFSVSNINHQPQLHIQMKNQNDKEDGRIHEPSQMPQATSDAFNATPVNEQLEEIMALVDGAKIDRTLIMFKIPMTMQVMATQVHAFCGGHNLCPSCVGIPLLLNAYAGLLTNIAVGVNRTRGIDAFSYEEKGPQGFKIRPIADFDIAAADKEQEQKYGPKSDKTKPRKRENAPPGFGGDN